MVWRWPKTDILIASSKPGVGLESVSFRGSTMKEGSEGDAGSKDDPIPRDADSTVSNGSNGPLLSAVVASQTRRVPADSPRSQVMGAALAALGAEVASSAVATTTNIGNHGNLSLGRTTLANALLGITLDINRSNSPRDVIHGSSGNSSTLMGSKINSTNKVGKGDSNGQSRDKVFVCRVCNRSFGYKHVLQNHERTHTGEKPFECKECHKRFTRDHHLKTHMRLHTGEKPYHCHHCDRQFVQVANLRRHLRVHTGERPYSCNLCSSRFSDSNQLKAHVLIHEGVKPFQCHKCLGRFRRRHHLVHHKCPKDAENIGKPRRGRRPKAYDEIPMIKLPASTKLPILSPVLQERLSAPITEISLPTQNATIATSVITKNPSSSPPPPQPPAAHMSALEKSRRSNHFNAIHYVAQRQNGLVYPENLQSGPLDMSLSSAPNNSVSVIVPRNSAIYKTASMDGVLDLSNSRSDSEAEPIEEEVDEADLEDDCLEDGLESESGEESMHLGLSISSGEWDEEDSLHTKMAHEISNHRGNGDRYESEGDGNTVAAKLKLASS